MIPEYDESRIRPGIVGAHVLTADGRHYRRAYAEQAMELSILLDEQTPGQPESEVGRCPEGCAATYAEAVVPQGTVALPL